MSLATRCFACGTVFRVVQDQLKVSEGWVRCGRCNEVFNALETLFDLDRDTPPEWTPREQAAPASPSVHEAAAVDLEVGVDVEVGGEPEPQPAAYFLGPRREAESTPAMRIDERDRLEFPDAQFEPESTVDESSGVSILLPLEAGAPPPAPEFMRHAQRQARWQTPVARAALGVIGVLLLGALMLQAAHHFRDGLAARWPEAKPALAAWCGIAGCSIQAPQHIEDIAVESTALTRADGPETFRFAVTLRNRAATPVAIPAVDLSLTDPSGQLVARRMLTPSEFRVGSSLIQAGAELPMQLLLTTGSTRVTGYTVEIFYP